MWDWLCDLWDSFWWDYEKTNPRDVVYGGSHYSRRSFKTGNLALIIALITLTIVLIKTL